MRSKNLPISVVMAVYKNFRTKA